MVIAFVCKGGCDEEVYECREMHAEHLTWLCMFHFDDDPEKTSRLVSVAAVGRVVRRRENDGGLN